MDKEQRTKAFLGLQIVFKGNVIAAASVVSGIIYAPAEREFILNTNERVLKIAIEFRQFLEANITNIAPTAPSGELLAECIDIQKSIDEYLQQTTLTEQTRSICLLLHASAEVLIGILAILTQTNKPVS